MKRILITAALPYANGDIHLGGIRSTYLPADVYARYCRLKGYETLFVCATDEHGAPIEINAAKKGVKPEEFTGYYHERQAEDFRRLGVSFDVFHRTHSKENEELSRLFFLKLKEKNLIFKKKVLQTYCENCKRVLPDRYVKGTCPYCGEKEQYGDACEKCGKVYSTDELVQPFCVVCGKAPSKQEVEHYFFKLSALGGFLEEWLAGKDLQKDVVHYVSNWLKELQDWDITRDGPYFGIKIPGEESQFFYVWFDAPIGYIASTKKWCDDNGGVLDNWWKNKGTEIVHFIGKDIVYHHYLFWPAMLDGAGYALPKRIPARGYLNVDGEKMSKSRGNFVLLGEALDKYPADCLRYYLTSITPNNTTDGNFTWAEFRTKANNELIDSYANFVYRVLTFVQSKFGGEVPEPAAYSEEDNAFAKKIDGLAGEAGERIECVELKEALETAMLFAGDCNKYFNARGPWKLLKEQDKSASTVIYLSVKAVYALALTLSPFLPDTSEKVFKQLGLKGGRWGDYSALKPGASLSGKLEVLFQKLE